MNSVEQRLRELLDRHIIVADSAIGTNLIGTRRDILPDTLSLSDADRVVALYETSIKAGATILTSNTFLSDPLSLASCGITATCDEIVKGAMDAMKQARKRCDKELFLAGSIGPSTRNISLAIDLTEDELRASYRTLIEALHREGAEIFLIESITDVRNAEIAAEVCREVAPNTPIIFSATLSKIGGLLSSGRSIERYVEDVSKFNLSFSHATPLYPPTVHPRQAYPTTRVTILRRQRSTPRRYAQLLSVAYSALWVVAAAQRQTTHVA